MFVRVYTTDSRAAWDSFVDSSKNGTFLFKRDYMDYHGDRFDDFSAIVTGVSEEVLALFPANRIGGRLVSHGGLSYGGMVSDYTMTSTRALDVFAAWLRFCETNGVDEIIYKTVPAIYHRAPADEDRYALFYYGAELYRRDLMSVVPLTNSLPIQQRRLRGMKQAARKGLQVRYTDDLRAFWPILEENLRSRHRLRPVHTVAEIELLRDRFPSNIQLAGVFDGRKMCAGTVLYITAPTVHAQYIASTEAARSAGALDLLFLTLIDEAKSNYLYFDFGNSNEQEGKYLNRGLTDFKEGFGARAVCHDFCILRITSQ